MNLLTNKILNCIFFTIDIPQALDFNGIARVDLKVRLVTAGPPIPIDAPPVATDQPHVYKVRFMPPKDPPIPQPPNGYSPELVVREALTIESNVKLKYK